MALHTGFPHRSPHAILDPAIRWFPADEALRASSFEKLLPPLVPELRKQVKAWRDSGYDRAQTQAGACSIGGSRRRIFCRQSDGNDGASFSISSPSGKRWKPSSTFTTWSA